MSDINIVQNRVESAREAVESSEQQCAVRRNDFPSSTAQDKGLPRWCLGVPATLLL